MRTGRLVSSGAAAAVVMAGLVLPAESAAADTPTLRIGALLPQTGNLKVLGAPTIAGVRLAVQDINAAGGVFGKPVEVEIADSGDASTQTAITSVDRLLANGADVIVGPASSAVAMKVIERVTSSTLMIAPSATSTAMSNFADNGRFFRTAPTDPFQGHVVGDMARRYGGKRLAILANRGVVGQEMLTAANKRFRAQGGKTVAKIYYDFTAADIARQVTKVKAKKADAIALFGFEESRYIIKEMRRQGLLPQNAKRPRLYLADTNMYAYKLPKKTLNGVRGVIPGAWPTKTWFERLQASAPGLTESSFAAEAYDATILAALAAHAAGDDRGYATAPLVHSISKTGNGCTTFALCVQALNRGEDIDYDGVSGRIEFNGSGDPGWASMGIYKYGKNNRFRAEQFYSGPTPEVS